MVIEIEEPGGFAVAVAADHVRYIDQRNAIVFNVGILPGTKRTQSSRNRRLCW